MPLFRTTADAIFADTAVLAVDAFAWIEHDVTELATEAIRAVACAIFAYAAVLAVDVGARVEAYAFALFADPSVSAFFGVALRAVDKGFTQTFPAVVSAGSDIVLAGS